MRTLSENKVQTTGSTSRRTASSTDAVLTAEGRALLARKVAELRTVIVPALLAAVVDDRHDEQTRSAYDGKLAELLRLEAVLARSRQIPRHADDSGQVRLGDLITVAFLPARRSGPRAAAEPEVVEQYRLVHPVEAPLDMLRISVMSPLGQAVLGRSRGDLVEVNAPAGRQIVRILDTRGST